MGDLRVGRLDSDIGLPIDLQFYGLLIASGLLEVCRKSFWVPRPHRRFLHIMIDYILS